MLFGKRGKSGLVALNLDLAEVVSFVKERLGKEVLYYRGFPSLFFQLFGVFPFPPLMYLVMSFSNIQVEMSGCKGPITTFIVEPFIPHNEEFYLNIVSERLGNSISFSECGGIEIEDNWDKVLKYIFFTFQIKQFIYFVHVKFPLIYVTMRFIHTSG